MAEINPLTVLERLGIEDYLINANEEAVWLTRAGLKKVAAFFDEQLRPGAVGIIQHGWAYRTHQIDPG